MRFVVEKLRFGATFVSSGSGDIAVAKINVT